MTSGVALPFNSITKLPPVLTGQNGADDYTFISHAVTDHANLADANSFVTHREAVVAIDSAQLNANCTGTKRAGIDIGYCGCWIEQYAGSILLNHNRCSAEGDDWSVIDWRYINRNRLGVHERSAQANITQIAETDDNCRQTRLIGSAASDKPVAELSVALMAASGAVMTIVDVPLPVNLVALTPPGTVVLTVSKPLAAVSVT